MDTNEENQEHKEETPVFSFKEITPSEGNDFVPLSDVVEIPDEVEEQKAPEIPKEEETKAPEEKEEDKKPEEKEEKKEEDPADEIVDLDEEVAFKFLKDKKGLKFDNLDDFIKSTEAKKGDPEIEKYQEYKAKTGRSYSDFLETQKDWSKEDPSAIIKAVLKLENPDLTNDDIDFLFEKDYGYDEEIDADFDIRAKKIDLKVDAKKALAKLEKQKEDYMVERGSDDNNIPDVYKEAKDFVDRFYDEQIENEENAKVLRSDFVSKMQSTLHDKFDGFEFTIDGQDFKVKPEDLKETREALLDIANFQKTFFDKENKLNDPKGYGKALYGAMNIDKIAQHFFNLGKTTYAENLEKESKNIDVKGEKHIPEPALSNFTFKKV